MSGRLLISLTILCIVLFVFFYTNNRTSSTPDESLSIAEALQSPTHDESEAAWRAFIAENFAFDAACAQCHADEFAAHQRSGHSRTATRMPDSRLAQELLVEPYPDPRRDQTFFFELQDELLAVGQLNEDASAIFPVHWTLGSGTHAQTQVSIDPVSRRGVEFRWSWFARNKTVGVTPDHERFDEYRPKSLECFGRPLGPEQALACLACHMTVVPPLHVSPGFDAFVANVGCERCHGPRKKHVEQALLGRAEESPPIIIYDDPERSIRQCAQCHRDETNTPADSSPGELARYQPYGLLKSQCYQKSEAKLTCSTCHNPHDTVSHNTVGYIRVCQQCHSAPDQISCPIEPIGNCIHCHMPKMEWHSGIEFHDHWIRVPHESLPTGPVSSSYLDLFESPLRDKS